MYPFKLQIGCLVIVLYFIVSYVKATAKETYKCDKYYDVLLYVAPWAIIFDGITAWTVNNQGIVPEWLNLLFHCLFFLSNNAVIIIVFAYTVNRTIGIKNVRELFKLILPGIIAQIFVIAFIGSLKYIPGETTFYSMGKSVVISYLSLLFHVIATLVILIVNRRTVRKREAFSIGSFYLLILGVLFVQVVFPESLISSLFPTLSIIGIYIIFENPALHYLRKRNDEMVAAFATLVENRDDSTGGHIRRTRGYVNILLKEMQKHYYYREQMTGDYVHNVKNAAPMHDIGKIATPDTILQKPGKLTAEEYEIMKQHASAGGEMIEKIFSDVDSPDYQKITYEMARYHHEKWNGLGYPDGLRGEEIPLHARVMAIADVFDAVSAKRCYRDAMPIDKCVKIIQEGAGKDFDPQLVGMFTDALDQILAYYEAEKDA